MNMAPIIRVRADANATANSCICVLCFNLIYYGFQSLGCDVPYAPNRSVLVFA